MKRPTLALAAAAAALLLACDGSDGPSAPADGLTAAGTWTFDALSWEACDGAEQRELAAYSIDFVQDGATLTASTCVDGSPAIQVDVELALDGDSFSGVEVDCTATPGCATVDMTQCTTWAWEGTIMDGGAISGTFESVDLLFPCDPGPDTPITVTFAGRILG